MHRHRVEELLERALAADLADRRSARPPSAGRSRRYARRDTGTRRSAWPPKASSHNLDEIMSESAQRAGIQRPTRARAELPRALADAELVPAFGVAAVTALAAAFLLHQLIAWPPHEDETLALFVGRHPLDELFETVLAERGGAPLHFLFAWLRRPPRARAGRSPARLGGVRGREPAARRAARRRLAGRRAALVATAIAAASWMFLFHGVYGRMYSLFLFTSAALVPRAPGGARPRRTAGAGPCGRCAVLAHGRGPPLRRARAGEPGRVPAGRAARPAPEAVAPSQAVGVLVLGMPFWLANLVLAGRFDVGVGGGGAKLGSPVTRRRVPLARRRATSRRRGGR